ncbi:MAG: uracil-DNA glycosylase [Candidatus Gracilibacteria bacterium]|nr:uracil-DNA glycosylase [Candidatus Gracilibacteria bacterium]
MIKKLDISQEWENVLQEEFQKDYFKKIKKIITDDIEKGIMIYPHPKNFFRAFELCDWDNLKVVIIGQDPYHGPNQAHGLCFSVQRGVQNPPSLRNMFKELKTDLNIENNEHGNLEKWAQQGILMLNATLSVRAGEANSHSNIGWQNFTDEIIKYISDKKSGIIFVLWGNYARSKKKIINLEKHFILEGVHPSPLSASRGFFGCKHFSKINDILEQNNKEKIDWKN